jgi:uncharacterized DUF497 family protein
MHMEIEWDADKAASNLRKHGVSFEEAATALLDPMALAPRGLERRRRGSMGIARHERATAIADGRLHPQKPGSDPTHFCAPSHT